MLTNKKVFKIICDRFQYDTFDYTNTIKQIHMCSHPEPICKHLTTSLHRPAQLFNDLILLKLRRKLVIKGQILTFTKILCWTIQKMPQEVSTNSFETL